MRMQKRLARMKAVMDQRAMQMQPTAPLNAFIHMAPFLDFVRIRVSL